MVQYESTSLIQNCLAYKTEIVFLILSGEPIHVLFPITHAMQYACTFAHS